MLVSGRVMIIAVYFQWHSEPHSKYQNGEDRSQNRGNYPMGQVAIKRLTLRILGMSWGVKTTCFEGAGVSLGGSGVSIGGVRILRVSYFWTV